MTLPNSLHAHLASHNTQADPFDLDELAIAFPKVGKLAIGKAMEELVSAGRAVRVEADRGEVWRWGEGKREKQGGLWT